jgi:hypothetical protein
MMEAVRRGAAVVRTLRGVYESAGYYRRKAALSVVAAVLLLFSLYALTTVPRASAASGLFSDDFETDAIGSVPTGWTVVSGSAWSVQQDGTHVLKQNDPSTANAHVIVAGSASWTDYTVQASMKPGANDLNQSSVLMARFVDNSNHYSFLLKNNSEWYLGSVVNGNWTTFGQGTFNYSSQFYTLTLTVKGSTISGAINGTTLVTATDTSFASGMIGFSTKATSELDNVVVSSGSITPTPTPTPTQTPSPTPTPTQTPTPTPTPTPPPPPSGGVSQLSVTTSGSGVTVKSLDSANNGWSDFFNSSAGGDITNSGEIDQGAYTELEAQNTQHGRLEMYLHTSGDVWLVELQNPATITVLHNTPGLVELQTVSVDNTYHLTWTTTYAIWPDGEVYVLRQVTNTASTALALNSTNPTEIDFGGMALTYYQDQAPNAWYVNGSVATSPIPSNTVSSEARLFAHMPTAGAVNMGYLLDKFTPWSAQGISNAGIAENQNTFRAKDEWFGTLSSVKSGQTLSFLYLYDQRRALTQAQSVAIDADYRAPSVTVNAGTLATSDNEPTGATVNNGFNMNLGAYVIAASGNHVNAQLGFPSGVTTRTEPRFKITNWAGGTPSVTWGGQLLTSGSDYTYTLDSATNTLYIQLNFDVVAANAQSGQRVNAALDIS